MLSLIILMVKLKRKVLFLMIQRLVDGQNILIMGKGKILDFTLLVKNMVNGITGIKAVRKKKLEYTKMV